MTEQERPFPFHVEQKAAIRGILLGLLSLGNTKNKKSVKKLAKKLKVEVSDEIGVCPAKGLLEGNVEGIKNIIDNIRGCDHPKRVKVLILNTTKEQWEGIVERGLISLYGQ